MVNALQRRSAIIVQKSLAEGFGLTVAEGMWKARPVVAGRVGGIQDQIADADTGVLVDPTDLQAFGSALAGLLADPARMRAIGEAAHRRAVEDYLAPRHLIQWVRLLGALGRGADRSLLARDRLDDVQLGGPAGGNPGA